MKILLAVDGSEYTQKMLDYVTSNSQLFDASHEYVLFNAQLVLPPHARASVGNAAVQAYYEEEAKKVLDPALAKFEAKGFKARAEWKDGQVGDTIAHKAEEGGFDMIIMGTHGHGSLARLVMGSIASQVLAKCTVPVLLIR